MTKFGRIRFDPRMMGGRACIRGMRITVSTILDALASGYSIQELLKDYPSIQPEDIRQALLFSADLVREHRILTE